MIRISDKVKRREKRAIRLGSLLSISCDETKLQGNRTRNPKFCCSFARTS